MKRGETASITGRKHIPPEIPELAKRGQLSHSDRE